jgi:hypothetical protein
MPFEVRMPQLGMNQDSATIVAWLKNVGDKVTEGEAIFEVETDKTTMEVEAQSEGYLSGIQVKLGVDIPVGELIATIVENKKDIVKSVTAPVLMNEEDSKSDKKPKDPIQKEVVAERNDVPKSEDEKSSKSQKLVSPIPVSEKVLASPKAKVIAAERGIQVSKLRSLGLSEPIHVADIMGLPVGGQSNLMAVVDDGRFLELVEISDKMEKNAIFVSFLRGSWRLLFPEKALSVQIINLDGSVSSSSDAEPRNHEPNAASISLFNLCETKLFSYGSGSSGNILSIGHHNGTFILNFSYSEVEIQLSDATKLIDEIAERVANPIRQLL